MSLQELLKSKDINIDIADIDSLINQKGVIVKVVVKGGKNSYRMSPKVYGVKDNNLSDDSREFLGKHTKNGSALLIPSDDPDGKKITSIQSKLRKRIATLSIGFGNSYVPKEHLPELKEYFLDCKDEFEEARDSILRRYSVVRERFIEVAQQAIKDLDASEGEAEMNSIINGLPDSEKFKNSFEISLMLSVFPETEDDGLEMQEDVVAEMITTGLTKMVDDIIESVSGVINGGSYKGRIHQKILAGVKNCTDRIKQNNIFGNDFIDQFGNRMLSLMILDADGAIEGSERILGDVYFYAKSIGLEPSLNKCPFTSDELIAMHDMYN